MITLLGETLTINQTAAAVCLVLFCLLGAFDGFYFHLVKYQLHKHPESRLEHAIHTIRGLLFVPVALIFFATNSGGWLLAAGCAILAVDLLLELADILVEKKSREAIGGLSSAEAALHVLATGFRMAALAFVIAMKPEGAFDLDGPLVLAPQYPLAFQLLGVAFAIGAGIGSFAQLGFDGVSREGVAWKDYRKVQLLAAAPAALALDLVVRALKLFVKEDARPVNVPQNALAMTYHADALLTLVSDGLQNVENGSYLGFHGFASYFPTWSFYRRGIRAVRYTRRAGSERPLQFIVRELQSISGPMLLRTDSGKPYGRVRPSIVDLALATNRPIVAVRQEATNSVTLFEHTVPLPGARISTRVSRVVQPDELRAMSRDEARELLQGLLDSMTQPPPPCVLRRPEPLRALREVAR